MFCSEGYLRKSCVVLYTIALWVWCVLCVFCAQVADLYEKTHLSMGASPFKGYITRSWVTLAKVSSTASTVFFSTGIMTLNDDMYHNNCCPFCHEL